MAFSPDSLFFRTARPHDFGISTLLIRQISLAGSHDDEGGISPSVTVTCLALAVFHLFRFSFSCWG